MRQKTAIRFQRLGLSLNCKFKSFFDISALLFADRQISNTSRFAILGNMSFESPRLYIGEPAPDFKVPALIDGDFTEIELSKFGKGKYVVLFFYPADFTFVCPTELIAYSERIEEFKKINCEVIGASTDTLYTHLAWVNTPRKEGGIGPLKYPLLADRTAEVAKRYGLYDHGSGNAYRGLFIIDGKGNLRQITINDMPVGRSVDETLRLVQAFQFVEEHGQVCPANWKPGQDAMYADPLRSKQYFTKSEPSPTGSK